MGTPVLGLAYDASRASIRFLRGAPGAAVLGDAIDIGLPIAAAAVSPRQEYALAVSRDDQRVRLVRVQNETPSIFLLEDAMSAPSRMLFSPSGTAAALYDQGSGRVQILTGLPGLPALREAAGLAQPADAMAVADDGTLVFTAGDAVRSIGPDLNPGTLAAFGPVGAFSFARGSRDFVAITHSGDLYLARNVDANWDIRRVYVGDDLASDPVAVQVSADGLQAYIANRRGTLAAVDLKGGAVRSTSCNCIPTVLQPLSSGSVFRLTEISARPVLLLQPGETGLRTWFIPADPPPIRNEERSGQ